jgi:hypothetical protein
MTRISFALVDPLLTLGLTMYEARVYLALTDRCGMTATQVASAARIPRQRVYDVLESLTAKGLALRHDDHPARFDALDPESGIAGLLEANRKVARHLASRLRPAWLTARQEQCASSQAPAPGAQVTVTEAGQWREATQHSVLATACPPFDGFADPSWIQRVEQLTDAGGTVRCVYHRDILDDPELLAGARHFAEAGEDARVTLDVPSRMILTDGRRALLPLPHPAEAAGAVPMLLVESPQVIRGLEKSFESLWSQATPLHEAADGLGNEPQRAH